MLDEWKTSKKVVRVIVTDMDINLAMLMDELNYSVNEGTRIFIIPCLFRVRYFECPNGKYNAKGQGQWPYRSAQYQRRWKPYGG